VTSARVSFNVLVIAIFLLNSFGAEKAARGKSRTSGLSLEPFRTFRILDAKLSVLTSEQVALDRSLNGDSTPKGAKEVEAARPSPDGHHLAFGDVVSASNVWLVEGFPK
jgi:hypothetical protein